MALSYHLVKRPDMRKNATEGAKLFYAQVRSLNKIDFEKFCEMVALRSAAFTGDIKLVIEGILSVMEERMGDGDVIQLGRLGNFRMIASSRGAAQESEFNTSYFKKARIVFSPGTMLKRIQSSAQYSKIKVIRLNNGTTVVPDEFPDEF